MLSLKLTLVLLFITIVNGSQKYCPYRQGKMEIKPVTQPVEHGEEPHWDAARQSLYFVDITESNVLRYHRPTGSVTGIHIADAKAVTPVIPVRNNPQHLVIGVDRMLALVKWSGSSNCTYSKKRIEILEEVQHDFPQNRFNDGKADKHGRLWIGTIGRENWDGVAPNTAALYRMTGPKLSVKDVAIPNVTNSNGLCWNKANNMFFYIDTQTRKIAKFDYDAELGQISNRRVAFDLSDYSILDGGLPDGMTIDQNDNLWIALYHGHAIIHVDPRNGKLLQRIEIPARDVTSTMFGGKHLEILYVTTSRRDLNADERKQQPFAGSVFEIKNLGVCGHEPPFTVAFTTK